MITTKILGLDSATANPKPVRGVNYAGQPMSDDEYYNGRPEHQAPTLVRQEVTSSSNTVAVTSDAPKTRKKRRHNVSGWTAEKRAAFGEKVRAYYAAKKARSDANTGAN